MSYNNTLKSVSLSINNLIKILQKLPKFIEDNKSPRNIYMISEDYILSCRIAPDMFPLSKQIQIVSDMTKGMASKLAGIDAPKMNDDETTISDLIIRLQKTLEFVESITEENLKLADTRKAVLAFMPTKYMEMDTYINNFAIPNIYFHITTSYNILRSLGVKIGKMDFVGNIEMKDIE